MIVHTAIFRWKSNVKKDEINKSLMEISKLKTKVPGIIDIAYGENFSKHSKGFTHAVVVIANNKNAIAAYREHPKHIIAAEKMGKMEEDGIGIDFESN